MGPLKKSQSPSKYNKMLPSVRRKPNETDSFLHQRVDQRAKISKEGMKRKTVFQKLKRLDIRSTVLSKEQYSQLIETHTQSISQTELKPKTVAKTITIDLTEDEPLSSHTKELLTPKPVQIVKE